MAKYSLEFKLQIVTEYLNRKGNYNSLAKKYKIPSPTTLKDWVKMYQTFDVDGLARKRENAIYSLDSHINTTTKNVLKIG